jgi:NTE family protein
MAIGKRKPVLGIALGGGGARGITHIGVLKILEAEGIHPQILAGTSMGGIIAALYASGMSIAEIKEEADRLGNLNTMIKLLDNDLTNFDFVAKHDNVVEYLRGLFKDVKSFSDLKIPLSVAAVDVMTASDVALQEGDLAEAVSATMALPGVIEPLRRDGQCLVDGGSLNNVPADLAESMGAEVVVAVDVSPDVTNEDFWKEQRMPGIAMANWRTNAIMVANFTAAKLRKARTDIVIRPEIDYQITTLSGFKHVDKLVDAGAKAALNVLPELRKLLKPRLFLTDPKINKAEPADL